MSAAAAAAGGDFQRELQQEVEQIQQQLQEEEGDELEVVDNHGNEQLEERFQLTEEERRWATQLKKAALRKTEAVGEEDADDDDDDDDDDGLLPVVSDFEYVQVAMIYKDDVEGGLRAIRMALEFRQQYGVESGNVEQGIHCMAAWMEQQPGFLLHMDVNPEGEAVKVFDPGVLNPKAALAGRNWKDFIRGVYYLHIACQPSLVSVRKGLTLLLDFGDVDSSNVSLDVQYQFFAELCSWYPVHIVSYMAFHTGFGATMRLSLLKAVMPKRISSKIQLGCEINNGGNDGEDTYAEDGTTINRLRQFYLVPTLEEAQLHTLHRAQVLLEERARNERTFQL